MTASLLTRLESLTAPSREIDAEIAIANGWQKPDWSPKTRQIYWRAPNGDMHPDPPRYTESIDMALTLAPDPRNWWAGPRGGMSSAACRANDGYWHHAETDATPAIALLIAILKASEDKP